MCSVNRQDYPADILQAECRDEMLRAATQLADWVVENPSTGGTGARALMELARRGRLVMVFTFVS